MLEQWLSTLGASFTPEENLLLLRWQCLLWSSADLAIIGFGIAAAHQVRADLGRRRHQVSWLILAATVLLLPLVWWAPNGNVLFVVECLVTIPHFLLLLYLLAANVVTGRAWLSRKMGKFHNGA